MTILNVVVGVIAFLVSGYFTYNLVRGKKEVPPLQEVAAAPAVQPKDTGSPTSPETKKVDPASPNPQSTTTTEYGAPVPEGTIISPVLVQEMGLILKDMAGQAGAQLPDDSLQQGIRAGISSMRQADAQLFCLTPDADKQLAECGEQAKSECLSEYNSLYSQLEAAKLDPPQMVSKFHESVKSGEATCGRVKALSQIMAAKLLMKSKSP